MTQNLNEAYDEYQRTKDLEALYPFVKQRCLQAAASVLHRTPQPDLVVTLTTDVLMSLHKFDAKKSAFSSWVFMDARRNCVNELKRGDAPYIDPITDDEGQTHFQRWAFDKTLDPPKEQETSAMDESLLDLYSRIETVLDPEEKELVRLKFEGREDAEVADLLQIPAGTMKWKYHEIKEKLRKAA